MRAGERRASERERVAMSSLRDLVLNESVEALAREFKAKPGTVNSKIGMVRK